MGRATPLPSLISGKELALAETQLGNSRGIRPIDEEDEESMPSYDIHGDKGSHIGRTSSVASFESRAKSESALHEAVEVEQSEDGDLAGYLTPMISRPKKKGLMQFKSMLTDKIMQSKLRSRWGKFGFSTSAPPSVNGSANALESPDSIGGPEDSMTLNGGVTLANATLNQDGLKESKGRRSKGQAIGKAVVLREPYIMYLRVHLLGARGLLAKDKAGTSDPVVTLTVDNQVRKSSVKPKTLTPEWDEHFMFVIGDNFVGELVVQIDDQDDIGTDFLGEVRIPISEIGTRRRKNLDSTSTGPRWYTLGAGHRGTTFQRGEMCLEAFFDEADYVAPELRTPIGKLHVGIINANIKEADGWVQSNLREALNNQMEPYCLLKYGEYWVRTRVFRNTLTPAWKERYEFPVTDPSSVVVIGVFNNRGSEFFGKVRIRLNTLDTQRQYFNEYPLYELQNGKPQKCGTITISIMFEVPDVMALVKRYIKPAVPQASFGKYAAKLKIWQPNAQQAEEMRQTALWITYSSLSASESSAIKQHAYEEMIDLKARKFTMRRTKMNIERLKAVVRFLKVAADSYVFVCSWEKPQLTIAVSILYVFLVYHAHLVPVFIFLAMLVRGLSQYKRRSKRPPVPSTKVWLKLDGDEEEETATVIAEADTHNPMKMYNIVKEVRALLDKLKGEAAKLQNLLGDVAGYGERLHSLLNWGDPRATAVFMCVCFFSTIFFFFVPFRIIASAFGLFMLRHPRFRNPMPPPPFHFYLRLPRLDDVII